MFRTQNYDYFRSWQLGFRAGWQYLVRRCAQFAPRRAVLATRFSKSARKTAKIFRIACQGFPAKGAAFYKMLKSNKMRGFMPFLHLFWKPAECAWRKRSDAGKTTWDVGKITSDIIQTTSDLFATLASICKTTIYSASHRTTQYSVNQTLKQNRAASSPKQHQPEFQSTVQWWNNTLFLPFILLDNANNCFYDF